MTTKKDPNARRRVSKTFDQEGGAIQGAAADTNINAIIARFEDTGAPPVVNSAGRFADVSESLQLEEALNLSIQAQQQFDALPARLRAAASNDVVQFTQMLEDPDGRELLADAGLLFDESSPTIPAEEPKGDEPNPAAQPGAEPSQDGGESSEPT